MNLGKLRISRRTVTIAVAFAGVVSLAIGAHAALNKRSLDAAKAIGPNRPARSAPRPAALRS